jgi:hypothetical protein
MVAGDNRRSRGGGEQQAEWLLIETLGWPTEEPTVVHSGGRPRKFQPLAAVLRGAAPGVRTAIGTMTSTNRPLSVTSRGRRVVAYPHVLDGRLHGIQYWSGRDTDPIPPLPRVAAFWIDLTDLTGLGSDAWAEMADLPLKQRGAPRSVAAMFAQVDTGGRDISAMRDIITMQSGNAQQGKWRVIRRDGTSFRCQFSCRIYDQPGRDGDPSHRVARGICHMATLEPESERDVLLVDQVLETAAAPDEYRALVSLQNLRPIRWVYGSPIPDHIAWQRAPDEPEPAIHPHDRHIVIAMAKGLEASSTRGQFRVRGIDTAWVRLDARADLVDLGQGAAAALVTFTATPADATD